MNRIHIPHSRSVALALGAFFVGAVFAQTHDHSAMGSMPMGNMQMAAANSNAMPMANAMADGEIKKIDLKANTVLLKHGPIKNPEMPAMTMSYPVKSPALLSKLKAGDKVKFSAEMRGDALVIMAIELAK